MISYAKMLFILTIWFREEDVFKYLVLIDFSLTVKAATLIFISVRGWLFHLLRKGNQVLFII